MIDGSLKTTVRVAAAALAGAASVVGALKSIVAVAAGTSLSLQQIAFYLGGGAATVYIATMAAVSPAIPIIAVAERYEHNTTVERTMWALVVLVWAALFVAIVIGLWNADVLFNYGDADAIARGGLGIIGLVAVGGGAWYAWKGRKEIAALRG